MSDYIRINMLGGFSMAYGANIVSDQDNRSKKVWTLLEYLITFHTREISHSALLRLLWPDSGHTVDSENALKTILHRARATLDTLGYKEKKLLLHRRNSYGWNQQVPIQLDTELFQTYCDAAADQGSATPERLENYGRALSLYKGRFLPKNSNDDWAIPVASYFHSLYLNTVHGLIKLLLASGDFAKVIGLCRSVFAIDPYDETVHYHLIHSLYMMGEQKEALKEYQNSTKLYYDTYGVNPSEEITALYQEITKQLHSPSSDIAAIMVRLREQNAKKRAYFCDLSVFENLYHIEARCASRSGLAAFLCLISLSLEKEEPDHSLMAAAMEKMADTIGVSLRAGDVYARYSVSQYIIMLSVADYENCQRIGSRILKRFYSAKPKLNVTADYALSELEPFDPAEMAAE